MSTPIETLDATTMPSNQEYPTQHSRSSSMQSTSTDYDADKDSKVPDLVRRDMEFFMARLSRTTSNDSTVSTASTTSR